MKSFSSLIEWDTVSSGVDSKLKVYVVGLSGKGPIDLQNRIDTFEGGSDFSSLIIANRDGSASSAINNDFNLLIYQKRFGYDASSIFTDNTKYSFNFWTKINDTQLNRPDFPMFVSEETIFHTAPPEGMDIHSYVGERDFGIKLAFDFERHQEDKIQFRVYVRYLDIYDNTYTDLEQNLYEIYNNWVRASDGSTGYLHYDANEAKNWHNYHFEITTTSIKLYIDSSLYGTHNVSLSNVKLISNLQKHIFMGYNQAYYANVIQQQTKRYWSSVIADFKIYNDVLSQQEITNVYNQTENYQGDGKIYGDKLKINESHFGVNEDNKQLFLKTGSHLPKGDTGNGISSTSYDANTDKLTITYTNANTDEISGLKGPKGDKGDDGNDGNGILSTSYNSATGQLTINFTSGLSYTTGSLKGSKGDDGDVGDTGNGISSTSYDADTDTLTITYTNANTDEISGLKGGKGDTGKGISSTSYNSDTDTLTITYTDEATDALTGLKGPKGDKGDDGNGNDGKGISSTSYNSATDTLTITYTDSTTNTLTGLKGPKGDDGDVGDGDTGNGISSTSYNSATDTLTITYTDSTTNTLTGLKGPTGNDGNGITSTSYNSATDTLTITFTDGTTNNIQGLKGPTWYMMEME